MNLLSFLSPLWFFTQRASIRDGGLGIMSLGSMAWVAVGTAVLGAGATAYGSSQANKAARRAADANAAATEATNEANYRQFLESRGSEGSAILPMYLKPYEASLGESAAKAAQQLFTAGGGPTARIQDNERYLSRYNPAMEAGDGLVIDLATGKVGQQRRASLEPVLQARTKLARTRASAINDALEQTFAGLRAQRAKGGFRGGSTFDINRAVAATTGARSQAAEAVGQADLENAMSVQGLDESDLNMRIGALDMPYRLGQQRMAFRNLPYQAAADQYAAAMAPLNFFRIGPQQAPLNQTFLQPTVGNNGMALGAGLSQAAGSVGNYLVNQELIKAMNRPQPQQPVMTQPTAQPAPFTTSYQPVGSSSSLPLLGGGYP